MDLTLVLNSDVELESIEYFLELTNWTNTFMDVYINFTDPMIISKGQLVDRVICKIINPAFFRAAHSS